MTRLGRALLALSIIADVLSLASGCDGDAAGAGRVRRVTLAAYSAPREVYAELVPRFAAQWRSRTGETLRFEQSFQASGAQARAIAYGFEADVAALALQADVDKIAQAGLAHGTARVVSRSLVVIGVRPGNPKGIHDFTDLARADVDVLTPDVKMSGGAMWNVAAVVGAVDGDDDAKEAALAAVLARVKVFDKGARESLLTFESGAGDAVITYESEIAEARRAGAAIEAVIPPRTLVVEAPAVVVDGYSDAHETSDVAAAFVDFLATQDAQRVFVAHGFRDATATAGGTLFTIADLGGWPRVARDVFGDGALYDRALAEARRR